MYLFVFVGLAWLLTAPFMAVLLGRVIRTADRHTDEGLLSFLEADLARDVRMASGRS